MNCEVKQGETINPRKGVNVPFADIPMEYISAKDMQDLKFIRENDFDYVFSVVDEHVPMYLKMGANVIKPSMSYGNMPKNVSIMFWGLENITPKYKELFKLRRLN